LLPEHAVSRPKKAAPRIVLKSVQEVRRNDLAKVPDNAFSFTKPGLVLTFGVKLAEGRRVVGVSEPVTVRAVDTTGRDLTAIEPNFFGRRQHVEVIETFGDSTREFKEFKFTLALPDRRATSFGLAASVDLTTDAGAQEVVLDIRDTWTPIDSGIFPGKSVKARLKQGRNTVELEFVPGTIKAAIESVEVGAAGTTLEFQGTMWNETKTTYSFQGKLAPGLRVKLMVRAGLDDVPIEIDLRDQPLP
jgi:hypothetical protein